MVVEIRLCKNMKVFYQSGIHDKIGDVFQTSLTAWISVMKANSASNISALLFSYMPIDPFGQSLVKNLLWRW